MSGRSTRKQSQDTDTFNLSNHLSCGRNESSRSSQENGIDSKENQMKVLLYAVYMNFLVTSMRTTPVTVKGSRNSCPWITWDSLIKLPKMHLSAPLSQIILNLLIIRMVTNSIIVLVTSSKGK